MKQEPKLDLETIADLMERVHYEERTLMERLHIAVHPSEVQQLRELLDAAGYEPIQVVGSTFVEPGTAYIFRDPDLILPPPMFPSDMMQPVHRKPLWRRIVESFSS